ncbi:MAG: SIR2 family protein, partial [Desulfobacula sp.]|uniref:SIR2 family NAD-dependent protein deacylase n=1 Tax=Desulfobacula sp. TaxID=2593537 RepID=UPI0025BC9932
MNEIPPLLIENIAKKNIVLFLGSGYLYNAKHPEERKAPLGPDLADKISDKFLNGSHKGSPLAFVADLAISEANLFEVQSYIFEIFENFFPNESHYLFASLPWKAIFTTNYDLIVERSYYKNDKAIQDLSAVYRNTPQQQIFKSENTVPYYKLHGCISHINDENLPLILSTEQYIDHLHNRERLFSKLKELASDFCILFVGYNNQDINIRTVLKELENLKDGKPRSYLVRPGVTEAEVRYWEARKITPIKMGYENFIKKVDQQISENDRKLSRFRVEVDKPIYERFQVNIEDLKPTESLIAFLEHESEYVHSSIASPNTEPQAFYRGYFEDWGPIIK